MGGTALSGYTLGICGTYDGQPAFAMCGHGLTSGKSIKYAEDSSVIGTVSRYRYEMIDPAIMALYLSQTLRLQEPIWLETHLTQEARPKLPEPLIALLLVWL